MSQRIKILKYLKSGFSITPREAQMMFGCWRLGAVIFRLRKQGWNIITKLQFTYAAGERHEYAEYYLRIGVPWPKTS